MLSSFVKKLMFARQFDIADGRIQVLGVNQVMLPAELLEYLQDNDPKQFYKIVKLSVKKDLALYAKKIGSDEEGIMNNLADIFEIFGIGSLEIESMDKKKNTATIRVDRSPFKEKGGKPGCLFTAGVLAGIFSYIFRKELDCKEMKCVTAGASYCEFSIA